MFFGGQQINLFGGNGVGGGGNDLTFGGPVNLTTATTTLNTAIAGVVEFSGGIGETIGLSNLTKTGFGTMVLSGLNTYSGVTTVGQNGGAIILRGNGALLNTSGITVNVGGEVILDNHAGANVGNRVNDTAAITLSGGTLTFKAKAGGVSSEAIGVVTLSDNTSSAVHSMVPTGSKAIWRIDSLDRGTSLAGEFVRFVGRGTDISADIDAAAGNHFAFTVAPSRSNGIVNFAVIDNQSVGGVRSGLNFATHYVPTGREVPTSFYGYLDVYNDFTDQWVTTYDTVSNSYVQVGSFAQNLSGSTSGTNVRLASGTHTVATGVTVTANAVLLSRRQYPHRRRRQSHGGKRLDRKRGDRQCNLRRDPQPGWDGRKHLRGFRF